MINRLTPSEAIRELEIGNAIIAKYTDCPPIRIEIHDGVVECKEEGKTNWGRGIGIQTLFSALLYLPIVLEELPTDNCYICKQPLSTTLTGKNEFIHGLLCDDCYYDELGKFIDENPIVGK